MKSHPMQVGLIAIVAMSGALAIAAASAGDERPSQAGARPDEVAAINQMVRADVNKDGVVTRDEVERINIELARRFEAADADRDGKLTLHEFETLRASSIGGTGGAAASGSASGSDRTGLHR